MIIPISAQMLDGLYEHWGMHLFMLKDRLRMKAYADAIEAAIKPNQIVIDIGTGTGILALLAARAGARRVYAIERGKMIRLARRLAETNGFDQVITFLPGDSRHLDMPQKADIIVSELIGIFGLHEDMLTILLDARKRFLVEGGKMIPSQISLNVMAVQSETIYKQTKLVSEDVFGLDFSPTAKYQVENIFAVDFVEPDVKWLSGKATLSTIDLETFTSPTVVLRGNIRMSKSGTIHGVGGFWDALLFGDVSLSTNPWPSASPTSWPHAFFPAANPLHVRKGDEVTFSCRVMPKGKEMLWEYEIEVNKPQS